MSALDRKLWRDLVRAMGQVATITAVMAVGIACYVALSGNYTSLLRAKARYYETERFADVFVQVERAPESIARDLEELADVARVETRIVAAGVVTVDEVPQPIRARLVSMPSGRAPLLNAVQLSAGRMLEPRASDEVVVLESFALAHAIEPGDELAVVVNGNRQRLRVVGLAASPEYVVALSPGELAPAPGRFAVLWLDRDVLAASFQMEGAFNDVSLSVRPGAERAEVLASVDRLLSRYGGTGAYGRDKQPSSYFVDSELMQLETMSTFVPAMFLGVAVLLINIVLARMIHLQRPQIATLKAVGYGDLAVGLHYAKLVGVIALGGSLLGLVLGRWLGGAMLDLYGEFYAFPDLTFVMAGRDAAVAIGVSTAAAALGAAFAIRRVVSLPPADAMRPATPARYRRSLVDRLLLGRVIGPSAQMVARELERRPLRALLSSCAIAASVGLMVVAGWYTDGIEALMYTQFHEVMREDVSVAFARPRGDRAVNELAALPGVVRAEGMRLVPVSFRHDNHRRDGTIIGYPDDGEMRALRAADGTRRPLPPDGVVLTDMLADVLGLEVGDAVEVDVEEGDRRRLRLVVTGLVDESFGLQGHMRQDALGRAMGEDGVVSLALLRVDPNQQTELDARLKEPPGVVSVTRRRDILHQFREQSGAMILTFAAIITLFAATITIGVVYNNARVALSLRSRDFASLRVLGFHRREISAVLLGEMAVQVLVALPLGLLFGTWLVHATAAMADPEAYRLPVILTARSYAFASLAALLASLLSALLVRRKLDRLDLISVLKTRE